MKKLLLVCAMFCMAFGAQAENQWEVKAGVGISTFDGAGANGYKAAFSWKLGAGYNFEFGEHWGFEPAIMFADKAFGVEGVSGTCHRYCFELPLLAAYKFDITDNIKFTVNAGPYLSVGVAGSDLYNFYTLQSLNVYDVDRRFEAGAQLGAKFTFNDKWSLGVDFQNSFIPTFGGSKEYTVGAGVTAGYLF